VAILDVDAAALVACPSDRLKIAADIAGPAACEAAVRQVDDAHGQLDVPVNNAGLGMGPIGENHLAQPVGLTEITPEHWRHLFEVNAWAPFSWRARRCPRWRRATGAG